MKCRLKTENVDEKLEKSAKSNYLKKPDCNQNRIYSNVKKRKHTQLKYKCMYIVKSNMLFEIRIESIC